MVILTLGCRIRWIAKIVNLTDLQLCVSINLIDLRKMAVNSGVFKYNVAGSYVLIHFYKHAKGENVQGGINMLFLQHVAGNENVNTQGAACFAHLLFEDGSV